jgi:hypothetical protein
MLVGVEAVLAKLGAIWTRDDVGHDFSADIAFISRTQ